MDNLGRPESVWEPTPEYITCIQILEDVRLQDAALAGEECGGARKGNTPLQMTTSISTSHATFASLAQIPPRNVRDREKPYVHIHGCPNLRTQKNEHEWTFPLQLALPNKVYPTTLACDRGEPTLSMAIVLRAPHSRVTKMYV